MEGTVETTRYGIGAEQAVIGEKEIAQAAQILQEYKRGKANLENRIVEDELWYQQRHWEAIRRTHRANRPGEAPEPSSGWLFNTILQKHADAMDNYPEPVVLPRERSDQQSAQVLSEILPVIMENAGFEETYSNGWWEKLKHGTAAYGIFWNDSADSGLGDVDIHGIDLLKIFWEPGITDIQKSRNLFVVDTVDTDILDAAYPQYKGRMQGNTVDVKEYLYDDTVDTSNKSVVVDWYYKKQDASGRQVLHYCKFVAGVVLYASENDPAYAGRGYYDHGKYPIVFDTLFPEKGTPVGFGFVAVCKDPQLYIDKISANVLEKSIIDTKQRYFMSTSTNVNREQLLNLNEPIVDVEGELSDTRLRQITSEPVSGVYLNILQMKIDEMKETAANRDMSNGGSASGITAASAIAALQEAGNKSSRDMISASYRAYVRICTLIIELERQFQDVKKAFRITAPDNTYQFIDFDNRGLRDQPTGVTSMGEILYRKPVFDLKIRAQRKNPFSQLSQNETAKELYGMGFFNPEMAQQSLIALQMMDFEGIDDVRQQVMQGQTLYNIVQQQAAQIQAISQALGLASGGTAPQSGQTQTIEPPKGNGVNDEIMASRAPRAPYAEALVKRSTPKVEG